MKKITILFFIIITNIINSQSSNVFLGFYPHEIPNAVILQSKYFEGSALWGHINGGADLYLEYGFDRLLFQEILFKEINFRIEIYIMNDPEAAFGVYSVNHYKCDDVDTLTKFICITPYQLQSAVNNYYISIANDKGNKEARELTLNFFGKILGKTGETEYMLPDFFLDPSVQSKLSNLKFFRGKLGLQNGFPQWLDLFDDFDNYEVYLLPVQTNNQYTNFSLIKFNEQNDIINFLKRIGVDIEPDKTNYTLENNTIKRFIKLTGNLEIIFIESDNKTDHQEHLQQN